MRFSNILSSSRDANTIFMMLDTVSLQRCRLVCKEWATNIDRCLIDSPALQPILSENWRQSNCSIYPLSPDTSDLGKYLPKTGASLAF